MDRVAPGPKRRESTRLVLLLWSNEARRVSVRRRPQQSSRQLPADLARPRVCLRALWRGSTVRAEERVELRRPPKFEARTPRPRPSRLAAPHLLQLCLSGSTEPLAIMYDRPACPTAGDPRVVLMVAGSSSLSGLRSTASSFAASGRSSRYLPFANGSLGSSE